MDVGPMGDYLPGDRRPGNYRNKLFLVNLVYPKLSVTACIVVATQK